MKGKEATRGWRKLRNLYSRTLRWAGHVALVGTTRDTYKILVGIPEGKRLHGRSRRRWEDNIRIDLRELLSEVVGWINLALVDTELSESIKGGKFDYLRDY
jgi:hypothetical protein